MSKSFGKWYYDRRTNSLKKLNKKLEESNKYEYFVGTFEKAVEYFGITIDKTKTNNKKLIDIVIYHQLDDRALTKTSAELFDLLVRACSTKNYWENEENRLNTVMDTIVKAKELSLIHDEEILKDCIKSTSKSQNSRVFRYYTWYKNILLNINDKSTKIREFIDYCHTSYTNAENSTN